ncbi:MAG: hypothetical protein GKR95_21460 [Gammaproteobacteria bacterium]|nr:hypothetical protein [Gammaproteobacteria bacterium]
MIRKFNAALVYCCILCLAPTTGFSDTSVLEMTKKLIPAMLEDHNRCRQQNGIELSDLVWDKNLARFATNYAETLLEANRQLAIENTKLFHSTSSNRRSIKGWKPNPVGENLGYQMNSRWQDNINEVNLSRAIRQTIDAWCAEVKYYDYDKNTCQPGQMCGHYIPIVWRSTTSVGCGVAVTDDGMEYFISCNYGPAGNFIGKKPY